TDIIASKVNETVRNIEPLQVTLANELFAQQAMKYAEGDKETVNEWVSQRSKGETPGSLLSTPNSKEDPFGISSKKIPQDLDLKLKQIKVDPPTRPIKIKP
ncbi:MAG: hypothetical protein AAGI38_24710, partial [Bacteroidota bacterium]